MNRRLFLGVLLFWGGSSFLLAGGDPQSGVRVGKGRLSKRLAYDAADLGCVTDMAVEESDQGKATLIVACKRGVARANEVIPLSFLTAQASGFGISGWIVRRTRLKS